MRPESKYYWIAMDYACQNQQEHQQNDVQKMSFRNFALVRADNDLSEIHWIFHSFDSERHWFQTHDQNFGMNSNGMDHPALPTAFACQNQQEHQQNDVQKMSFRNFALARTDND